MEENTILTSDAVLDAEQAEKVMAFFAEAIKEFLEENYEESEKLSTHHIEMDLQDHGKDYAIGQLYQSAQSDTFWLKFPEEDTDEDEEFRELLKELYFKALERVSWHLGGIVVSIEKPS
jgi:hypothetical protein